MCFSIEDANITFIYATAFYIGLTTVTLKERFKQHRSVKKTLSYGSQRDISCSEMLRNVSVIAKCSNKQAYTF